MKRVSPEIRKYIETKILPRYSEIGGHTDEHIQYVINRSLRFIDQAPELNVDMAYVVAAFHDLGRLVDQETHNIESGKMIRADKFLAKHFSPEEIEIMAQAVEDHRSSLGHKPRSRYGELVSSADRDTSYETMLSRVYDYTRHVNPKMTEDEVIEEARFHLRDKYSTDGYALKTMYFDDPEFALTTEAVERATRDFDTFAEIIREHNAKRGLY